MTKKTVAAAAVMFLAYTIFVIVVRPAGIFQNQWQSNIIKAQDYIYGIQDHRRVIVGSSLAASAFTLNTPDGYFDLSFAGGSPLDGLEVIRRSGILPEYLLIETNFFDRNSILGIDKTVFVPLITGIRRYVPSLQERYQPVTVILPRLFDLMRVVKKAVMGPAVSAVPEEVRSRTGESRLKPLAPAGRPVTQISPEDKSRVEKKLAELAKYIAYFSRHNAVIIFFEMPVHENAFFSAPAVYKRERLRTAFSGEKYLHIPSPDSRNFTYADGAHLDQPSARAYRRYFTAEADAMYRAVRQRGGNP